MTARCTMPIFPGVITLDTIPDLLAFHRATFGSARMEDDDEAVAEKAAADKAAAEKAAKEFQPVTSQEEFDRRLSERLAREREKFADYGDLKAKAAAHDKALEAAMSETEKAVVAARKEGEASARGASDSRLIKSEARALAAAANFRDPADAVAFLNLVDVKVGDDGEVDAKAIKDQLKALAETKAYLINDGTKARPKVDPAQGGERGAGSSVEHGRTLWESRHAKKTSA